MSNSSHQTPVVWSAVTTRKIAEEISDNATNSDALNYPATSMFEEDEGSNTWRIDLYLTEDIDEHILSSEIGQHFHLLTKTILPTDKDWVAEGLKDLTAVEAGRFFIHGSHERDRVRPSHHAIEINANQAFGTGHHGTTHGCLDAILQVFKKTKPQRILDLGTGTGVLALAAAKLARVPILATDIDPISVKITKENAAINDLAPLIHAETATGFHHPTISAKAPFDLIIANILAGPLCDLAPDLYAHTLRGSTIILSGLLSHQKRRVFATYRNCGFVFGTSLPRGEWVTLILHRP